MRTGNWDLGEGTVHVLESPDDLEQLRPRLRKLIPSRMMDLFRGFPASLEALAARTSSAPFAAWLRDAAGSHATVTVYDLGRGAGMPKKAWLDLDFGLRETAGGPLAWHVLADCHTGTSPHCPPALAEIYGTLGGLATQYGGSGTLIPPSEVRPLSEMGPTVAHLLDPDMGSELTPREARDWYAYYESNGDYLCYRRDGLSRWFGFEWAPDADLAPTQQFVDQLLRRLLAKEYFHG